ncbi:hypothetical protein D0B54_11515 [Solimonas sp. K1W22B-7]|uniref:hypothetical protein n=1 Tax=Solimonas sp. K1W22B-7 TaxID=2303331 RepID=UPI000E337399|nr:hypothetical protein [Solimonas sp. K1W22B-7]AXQ29278.1 hypothetical protein D0B54_11515 [Solimonas sp. K1W22B-7]
MNQAVPAGSFQVTLTGRRLSPVTDAELLQRLREQFGLSAEQAVQLLVGPLIVRQSLELKFAAKVASAFRACGMEALVEPMTGAEASAQPEPLLSGASRDPGPPAANAAETPLSALEALARQVPPASRLDAARQRQIRNGSLLCAAVRGAYIGFTALVVAGWILALVRSVLALADGSLLGFVYAILVPGLGGLLLIGLLLWPLLAPRRPVVGRLRLDPAQEPELFRALAALSTALGVPAPAEVVLDGGASLSIKPLSGGSVRLRVGLPLLASLSAREMTGLMAQQLALQAGGSDLLRILKIQRWLEQRAYDGDLWDEALERSQKQARSGAGQTMGRMIAAGLGVGRLLMAGLYHLSLLLGRKALHIAAFEADRRAATVVGSRLFQPMLRNQRAVDQATDEVRALASQPVATPGQQLPEDLFDAIADQFRATDAASLAAIDGELESLEEESPKRPAWGERISRVMQLQAAPRYASSLPARLLLDQYELYCLRLSREWYEREGIVRPAASTSSTHSGLTPAMRATREMQRETLERYFNGQFRPWPLLQPMPPADSDIVGLGWQGTIDTLRRRSPELIQDWVSAAEWDRRRAPLLLAAGLGMKPSKFGLSGCDHLAQPDIWRLLDEVRRRDTDAHHRLTEDLKLHAFRIECAIRAMMDQERLQAEFLRTLLQRLHEMEADASMLSELHRASLALQTLAADGQHQDAQKDLNESLRLFRGHAHRLLNAGHTAAQTVLEGGSVSGYLLLRCPLAGTERGTDAARYMQDAEGMAEAFQDLYQAALGELVGLCERAERASGIQPIRKLDPMSLGL